MTSTSLKVGTSRLYSDWVYTGFTYLIVTKIDHLLLISLII